MEYRGVLVGLGNPGREYAGTRHNMGFDFVDMLLARADREGGCSQLSGGKFKCELWRFQLPGWGAWLAAKPQTFMNLSGECVQPLLAWHKMSLETLVVVHDELDIPAGALRFKRGGGNAGHNGLKSITQLLGSPEFCRLRIGIGRPPFKGDVTNWVLGKPDAADRELQEKAFTLGEEVIRIFLRDGVQRAAQYALSQKIQ